MVRIKPAELAITAYPAQVAIYQPVSPQAKAVREAVRAPIQNRRPVGYQRSLLDDYRPNVTGYLPAETRQRLNRIDLLRDVFVWAYERSSAVLGSAPVSR